MGKATISGGGDNGLYSIAIKRNDGTDVNDSAYCVDLTEDLTGEVGLIEIAGDREKGINLQPGFEGNAVYNASRDGELKQIQNFPDTKPTQEVFYNWALRPGWAKWKPNYRYGTITAINYDADTCDVSLDACYATDTPDGKQLDINQSSSLSGVAIEYMSCDSAAFEVGDVVVVKFENFSWASPKVIGFKEEPKACYWEPWSGSELCQSHQWGIGDYDRYPGDYPLCPTLPYTNSNSDVNVTINIVDNGLLILVDRSGNDPNVLYGDDILFWTPSGLDTGGSVWKYKIEVSGLTDPGETWLYESLIVSVGHSRNYDDPGYPVVLLRYSLNEDHEFIYSDDGELEHELNGSSGTSFLLRFNVKGGNCLRILLKYVDIPIDNRD
jgi:hypothetical protein